MNTCPTTLAETGFDATLPLIAGVALIIAGVVAVYLLRRRARAAVVIGGVLLFAFAFAVAPSGAPAFAEGCPPTASQPAPPVTTPPTAPPTEPPVCTPSVALAPPTDVYWAQISGAETGYVFTLTPDAAWLDTLTAAAGSFTVAQNWTITGYVAGFDDQGNFVADTFTPPLSPWSVTATSDQLSFLADTTSAIDDNAATLRAAYPSVETTSSILTGITGGAVVTATYSDGCTPQTLSFTVTNQPGGGGGNN